MGAMERQSAGSLRQPDCIPERVVTHARHKAGADRVGDDVARGGLQIVDVTQGMVVEGAVPDRPGPFKRGVGRAGTGGLESVDDLGQAVPLAKLQQPVGVIGHQHPSHQTRIAEQRRVLETTARSAGGLEVSEDRRARQRGHGQVINLSRTKIAATS